jgi:hypothetical protein
MNLAAIDFSSVGVVGILVVNFWLLATGVLITRREANAMQRQIEAQHQVITERDQTIAEFRDAVEASNRLIQAVLEVAKDREK